MTSVNTNSASASVHPTKHPEKDLKEVVIQRDDDDDDDANTTSVDILPQSQRVHIEIDTMNAHVTSILNQPTLWQKLTSPKSRAAKKQQTQILFDVSASVKPGEVLALMGPSGSGKTTLLSIIGGRAPQRSIKVTGRVLFNGQPLNKAMKRKIGYVMQDDLLYESLTVYETLYYAAMLRLPRAMSRTAKISRVNSIITTLGLTKCKDTIIGSFFRRGISGGERKRTSVGHELLINPSTLFLDEPTSGLDSTTAMHLLSTLRTLAKGGRAVITTIHQPSSRIYQQLDTLLLLSGGHAIYYGRAQLAVDYFEKIGFQIPPRVNTADFILDLASGEVPSEEKAGEVRGKDGETCRRQLIGITEAFLGYRPFDGYDPEKDPECVTLLQNLVLRSETPSMAARVARAGLPIVYSSRDFGTGVLESENPSAVAVAALGGRVESGELTPSSSSVGGTSGTATPPNGTTTITTTTTTKTTTTKTTTTANSQTKRGKGLLSSANGGVGGTTFRIEGEDVDVHRWGAPFWSQVGYLFQRSLRTRRFQTLSTQDIFQFLTIGVLAGCFWLQKGNDVTLAGSRDVIGVLFFMVMFLSFRSLFVSLFTFPEEQRHMIKERASGMYQLSAFYLARLLSDFPMDLSIPTGFIIIVYFMAGLRYTAAAFFGIYGTLLLSMFVAQSLGLLLGSIFMSPKTAQTVAAVLMLTIVLTGGFFVTDIPPWISWLQWLSYIYYALGILMYVQYDGGNTVVYSCSAPDVNTQCVQTSPADPANDPSCVPISSLKTALGLLQDPSSGSNALRDGLVLLGFLVVLRVAVYYVLKRKTSGF